MVCLVLAACGATSKPVNGPDGEPGWYSISCRRDESNCIEEAGNVCPNGYVTADAGGHEGFYVNAQAGLATSTYRGHMLIKCKGPQ